MSAPPSTRLGGVDFTVWRIVLEGVATLQEIETWWSIDDLADAHEALDVKQALEAAALERSKSSGRR